MTAVSRYTLELPNTGRSLSDDGWGKIDSAHIESWKAATVLLGSHTTRMEGGSVKCDIDWRPVVRRLQKHYKVMQELYGALGTPAATEITRKFSHARVKVPITIHSDLDGDARKNWFRGEAILESYLHDTFLVMNIATPGSCDFYASSLRSNEQKYSPKISLTSYHFEASYLYGQDGKWPAAKFLNLESVSNWYRTVRSGFSQMPENRMEKVIFALLHISKLEISPTIIIWIFYSLETLFDTKAGENFRVLTERIILLLQPRQKDIKGMRKKLRTLYDLRSSFVHGGLEVVHPMHNESVDQRVDTNYHRLMEASEFGFALLLCAVQAVIERGWRWPEFEEILHGEPT